jgi:fatty acid desaturase
MAYNPQQPDIPQLPNGFSRRSTLSTSLYLGYAIVLAFVPGILASNVWYSAISAAIRLPSIAVLVILGGYGIFMLGATGHEGFHFNLHQSRFVSAGLGAFFSSAVPGFLALGFFINHWDHHRFVNATNDPDVVLLQDYRSFFARGVLARLAANRRYINWVFRILARRPLGKTIPCARDTLLLLAWLNLAAQLWWVSLYAAVLIVAPVSGFIGIILPMLFGLVLSSLNPFLEHAGTGLTKWGCARTRSSRLLTFLMAGTNFHLEHHLYPSVPCWRLPRLHRWLASEGWFVNRTVHIEPSMIKSFFVAAPSVPYSIESNVTFSQAITPIQPPGASARQ